MEKLQFVALLLSLILNVCSLAALIYAFKKFLSKPHEDLTDRVIKIEGRVDKVEISLLSGNDRFREQSKTNKAVFNVLLAFVDFEIAYCHATGYKDNEDLIRAKNAINEYLTDFDV